MQEEGKRFDVVVIGGGVGGYPAAIRAAQMGKSVALVEAKEMGGTCLNRGCIPSKALIANADVLRKIKEAEDFGIAVGEVSFDYGKMVQRKDEVVAKVRKSLEGLIASNKITTIRGFAKFISPKSLKVTGQDNVLLHGDKIIIATGSEPRNMPAFPFDYKKIHDSTSLLEMRKLPSKIVIVGGGVIGCEFASLFSVLGVEVVIVEMMDRIIPAEAENVSATLARAFKKNGIQIETNSLVQGIDHTANGLKVHLANGKTVEGEIALVAVGRSLNTKGIGLEAAGVLVESNGMIKTNSKMETNVPGIYAVGDIASTWWLAHVASHQGVVAATNAAGKHAHIDYNAVPNVIFTVPEIGTVGMTLDKALKAGYHATIGAFPFQALGKSQAMMETEGFAQVVIDKKTNQILGAQVVGHEASALIAEMALAISNELTVESVSDTIHAHPTLAEAWLEAVLIANDTPLHFPPKKG